MTEHLDSEETSEATSRRTISICALRQHADNRAIRLRSEIPLLLGRMAAEAPGTSLELQLSGRPNGIVDIDVHITGTKDLADQWCAEARSIVETFAEVESPCRSSSEDQNVWPIVPAQSSSTLGYSLEPRTAPHRGAGLQWDAPNQVHKYFVEHPVWLDVIASHPDHGLWVKVTPAQGLTRRDIWDVQLAVITTGDWPSLRMRSQIRTLLPGMEVAAEAAEQAPTVRVDAQNLPVLFAIPIAGSAPAAGACIGAAAPIPMHPTRHELSTSEGLRLGVGHTGTRQTIAVRLGSDEQLRHVHVLGRTGTGKSSLLAAAAHSIAEEGRGMLVLDPHGHLVDRILAELPDEAVARTRVIRSGDVDNPVPLNPLAVTDPIERDIAIEAVCAMFGYLFDKNQTGIVGPRFNERVAMGLRALATVHGPTASLLDVPLALGDDRFLQHAVGKSDDDRLKAWYSNDVRNRRSNDYGDLVSWVNSKFEAFTATAAMRAILGSGADAFDMAEAMDSAAIVLVDLSKAHLGEQSSRLLGYLHLNRTWAAGLRRTGTRAFTVIVDEVHSMTSGALTSMLSEGRKFGLSVIMAHQYLDQLDEDLRPAVDGNVATTVAFRCAASDAAALRHRFGDQLASTTWMTLPDLSAVILRSAAGGLGHPHTLTVDHNDRVHARAGAELDRCADAVSARTRRNWSDPFAQETRRARDGHSKLRPTDDQPPETPVATKPSFLDEWLARREQEKRSASAPA